MGTSLAAQGRTAGQTHAMAQPCLSVYLPILLGQNCCSGLSSHLQLILSVLLAPDLGFFLGCIS